MNIKVLQGINLKSPYSTVFIEMDSVPLTDILDLIASYHDIFIYEYLVERNSLIIRTKLPQLWKEAAHTLNSYSSGEMSYEDAKSDLLNRVIKGQVFSMSTIPLLVAARDMGLEINQSFMDGEIDTYGPGINKKPSQWNRYYRIGMGKRSCVTVSAGSSGDSILALKSSRDKRISNLVVTRLDLPIAPWSQIDSEEHLRNIFNEYEKPVVIKPSGLTQGSGVTTNINDLEHAIRAYKYALEKIHAKNRADWQKNVMIQQQVYGEDHRLLVINGKLEIVTKRIPAFVVGNGRNTIKELIEETNKDPRRDIENPAHTLKPINFDTPLDEFMAEKGSSLQDVPKDQERVYVRKVASMSQGGITEDLTDQVHPQIRYIVESIASSVHANVVGVDLICKDISKPLTLENGSFIEFNTMPEAYLNAFPVLGKQHPDIGEKIIVGLLEKKTQVQGIVIIGNIEDPYQALIEKAIVTADSRTGIYHRGSISINGEFINNAQDHHQAVRALKLNASLDNLVIVYEDRSQIEQYGTGFDQIDHLLTDQPRLLQEHVNSGLIRKHHLLSR